MDALRELPPLPKSLSGLINFSSSQWREVERVHLMRTMIQQDLSRSGPPPSPPHAAARGSAPRSRPNHGRVAAAAAPWATAGPPAAPCPRRSRPTPGRAGHRGWTLSWLFCARKCHEEMLLGQLNGAPNMASAAAPPFDLTSPVPPPTSRHQRSGSEGSTPRRYDAPRHPPRNLMAVPERTLAIDSSSGSSGEYDDVL
ncbi:hypothetical protein HPB48_013493 [Haemaphysalis longicornis]|uniref:Uncharacterized protein n=1 Tax=Haemaphysalis longicornis TaxID=44386 RepID=A0A9J6GAN9_HAELO|nr:hypothetical protein HPB48_013493 [Haemaphysalis longicornis]